MEICLSSHNIASEVKYGSFPFFLLICNLWVKNFYIKSRNMDLKPQSTQRDTNAIAKCVVKSMYDPYEIWVINYRSSWVYTWLEHNFVIDKIILLLDLSSYFFCSLSSDLSDVKNYLGFSMVSILHWDIGITYRVVRPKNMWNL